MGIGFCVTCFIDNLCIFDDLGVCIRVRVLNEHLLWDWEIERCVLGIWGCVLTGCLLRCGVISSCLGGLGTMEHWVLRDWDAYGVSSGV